MLTDGYSLYDPIGVYRQYEVILLTQALLFIK